MFDPVKPGTPQDLLEDILDAMLSHFTSRDLAKFETRCDELRAHVAPYLAPTPSEDWSRYKLTGSEMRIANLLYVRLGRPLSPQVLMDALYFDRPDDAPFPKIVDVFVCRIRKRLKEYNAGYTIETVRGYGFRLVRCEPGAQEAPKFTNHGKLRVAA